jgi:hypothetical protein
MSVAEHSGEYPLRYFLDTEFMEDGRTIDLISIGVVCEDGREFYAESTEARWSDANEWVQENVLPHLWARQADKVEANRWSRDGGTGGYKSRPHIAHDLARWVAQGEGRPEFWAYYADYDWVAVCQLFGTMMDLPEGWPMLCLDLKQEALRLGDPQLPEQSSTEHHALADARWNAEVYDFLAALSGREESS